MAKSKTQLVKNPYLYLILLIIVFALSYYSLLPKPVKRLDIYNTTFFFRSDIKEASKIEVYPNEQLLYEKMNNASLQKIIILFDKNESAIAALEGMEITYKLTYHYLATQLRKVSFSAYSLPHNITQDNAIYLIFNKTNNANIILQDNTVYLNYKDKKTADLVTIKLILTTFGLFE